MKIFEEKAKASVLWPEVMDPILLGRMHDLMQAAEARRVRADYDTGSILPEEAYLLLSLAQSLPAHVVIEVGTFIGLSTTALAEADEIEHIYTCDASNDCLDATDVITTYPKQSSVQMLRDLVKRKVVSDLCFFDGLLRAEDADLLAKVTTPDTVYAFHDYNYGPKWKTVAGKQTLVTVPRKGIGNVRLLSPRLQNHVLVEPLPGTTLALLVPR